MNFYAPLGAYGVVRFRGNYQTIPVADACKDTPPDAILTVNGNREGGGRSRLSEAKGRATEMLAQGSLFP